MARVVQPVNAGPFIGWWLQDSKEQQERASPVHKHILNWPKQVMWPRPELTRGPPKVWRLGGELQWPRLQIVYCRSTGGSGPEK